MDETDLMKCIVSHHRAIVKIAHEKQYVSYTFLDNMVELQRVKSI